MSDGTIRSLITSGVLLAGLLAVRWAAVRRVRRQDWASPQIGRRWIVQIRNAVFILMAIGLVFIWAEELRTAAISLVALGAAFVLATKELIMCVSGALVRTSSRSFTIGDRIDVGAIRGDVIDHTLLATTLLEVGAGHTRTGRTITIPNSMFLNQPVLNETSGHHYVLHAFTVVVPRSELPTAEATLLREASERTADYLEEAREQMERRAKLHSLDLPSVDPIVVMESSGSTDVALTVRFPSPFHEKGRLEQEIMRSWLGAPL
jgi:small-conductance mechanosensitive channel